MTEPLGIWRLYELTPHMAVAMKRKAGALRGTSGKGSSWRDEYDAVEHLR